MTAMASLNGAAPPEWAPHIEHLSAIHVHHHPLVGKEPRKCSGRWWCEKDKTWITGPKCEEK